MKKLLSILLSLFINISVGQTSALKLSNNLDKLKIGKSKEKSTIKTFGKPDSTLTQDILANIGGGCLDYSYTELIYSKLGLKLKFNGHYKNRQKRVLSSITILAGPILINETISVGTSSIKDVRKVFGENIGNKESDMTRLVYKINKTLVVFNFDSSELLKSVSIQAES